MGTVIAFFLRTNLYLIQVVMKSFKRIAFEDPPILITGWPGLGNAGILAVNYILNRLPVGWLSGIDICSPATTEGISIRQGDLQEEIFPANGFFFCIEPSLIFFQCDTRLKGREGYVILHRILDVARHYKAHLILTTTSVEFPFLKGFTPHVWCSCNSTYCANLLQPHGISQVPSGTIGNLEEDLTEFAYRKDIPAACLAVTVPEIPGFYPYPKSSLVLVREIERILDLSVDLRELEFITNLMDDIYSGMENRLEAEPAEKVPEPWKPQNRQTEVFTFPDMPEIPAHIMKKVEALFREVRNNPGKAGELRRELVRWCLYDKYEKRFLTLLADLKKAV
jgi:predicted ATP-grasp superfamily ATP-dependent carboligase